MVKLFKKAIRQTKEQKKVLERKEAEDLNLQRRLALPGDQDARS